MPSARSKRRAQLRFKRCSGFRHRGVSALARRWHSFQTGSREEHGKPRLIPFLYRVGAGYLPYRHLLIERVEQLQPCRFLLARFGECFMVSCAFRCGGARKVSGLSGGVCRFVIGKLTSRRARESAPLFEQCLRCGRRIDGARDLPFSVGPMKAVVNRFFSGLRTRHRVIARNEERRKFGPVPVTAVQRADYRPGRTRGRGRRDCRSKK